ncbi:hypothetical protein R3W88_016370 [Solanum pinnatisectum]|uniref:Rubisco LSMT substrate-binding domain-containing protein n=1 Tax=Solanum pinnatisectum TaxID=50273 RepID=A0AAV9L1E9_9SOLN|nr:hypothetical protein R3W88_016370 [Solanum pinnatisectum]
MQSREIISTLPNYPPKLWSCLVTFHIKGISFSQVEVELTIPHEDKLRQLKLELLSKHQIPILKDVNGFSSSENSFALKEVRFADAQGRGIPQSIRAFARILCSNSPQEINYLAMEAAENDGRVARRPLKDKSREIQAHQFLLSKITGLIDEYNASIKVRIIVHSYVLERFI